MLCYLPGFCIFIFIFFINFLGGWGLKEPHFIAKENTDLESHRHLHNDDKKIFIRKKKNPKNFINWRTRIVSMERSPSEKKLNCVQRTFNRSVFVVFFLFLFFFSPNIKQVNTRI